MRPPAPPPEEGRTLEAALAAAAEVMRRRLDRPTRGLSMIPRREWSSAFREAVEDLQRQVARRCPDRLRREPSDSPAPPSEKADASVRPSEPASAWPVSDPIPPTSVPVYSSGAASLELPLDQVTFEWLCTQSVAVRLDAFARILGMTPEQIRGPQRRHSRPRWAIYYCLRHLPWPTPVSYPKIASAAGRGGCHTSVIDAVRVVSGSEKGRGG